MNKKTCDILKKLALSTVLILILSFFMDRQAHAAETENNGGDFFNVWGEYGIDGLTDGVSALLPEYNIDMELVFQKILAGQLKEAAGTLLQGIKEKFFNELAGLKNIFSAILLLGIVSALFANFADVFQNHQIADISFYFLYLLLMVVLLKAFLAGAAIASDTMNNIVVFIKMFIPTYFMAVGAATGATTAVVYYQFMLFVTYGVEKLLVTFMLPFIYSYVLLALMNGIWAEERLALILDFIKKAISMCLKIAMGTITGVSLMQAMITPVIDSLKTSAVKKAISVIPGIGNLAEGVTEVIIGSAVLIKNSIGIFMLFLLLLICAMPLLKLMLIACIMKGSAALVGIVSDKRLTSCTDKVGDGSMLLLKLTFTSVSLFIITIAIVAYTTGKGL